jgi:hypothetical protein
MNLDSSHYHHYVVDACTVTDNLEEAISNKSGVLITYEAMATGKRIQNYNMFHLAFHRKSKKIVYFCIVEMECMRVVWIPGLHRTSVRQLSSDPRRTMTTGSVSQVGSRWSWTKREMSRWLQCVGNDRDLIILQIILKEISKLEVIPNLYIKDTARVFEIYFLNRRLYQICIKIPLVYLKFPGFSTISKFPP